tara:strand:- start:1940 stop:3436 length:1497 start_codon:yes stop_codon:yes gene_type:complete
MTGILMASVGNSYGAVPINTVAPAVTGTASFGSTLTTTNGTWTGAPAPTFTYQWFRSPSTSISGATSSTYVLVAADVGFGIFCQVRATNSVAPSGVTADSNTTATVVAVVPGAPTIGTATATGTSTATVAYTAPASNGGATITQYDATSSPAGGTGTLVQAGSGTINVTGLTASTGYTFTVKATNSVGQSAASAASNSITTDAPLTRGVWFGGYSSGDAIVNNISYVNITSTGNAADFGDLATINRFPAGCGSITRGIIAGGGTGSDQEINTIQYITFATTGDTTDFGDMSVKREATGCCNSSTRGLIGGGYRGTGFNSNYSLIEYITIATTGNASTFGDLAVATRTLGSCSSPTRGIFGGGSGASSAIYYVTIASTGNSSNFGNLSSNARDISSCSSATRGLFGAMNDLSAGANVIEYITIASTGNTTDFGDLTIAQYARAACSSSVRGVFGGATSPYSNVMDYVTIATTGNATDFGDLPIVEGYLGACSSSNGGVQ